MSRGFIGEENSAALTNLNFGSDNGYKNLNAIALKKKNEIYDKRQDISQHFDKRDYFKALELSEDFITSEEIDMQDIQINTNIVNKIIGSVCSFLNGSYPRCEEMLISELKYFERKIERNEKLKLSLSKPQEHENSSSMHLHALMRDNKSNTELIHKAHVRLTR